MPPEPMPTRIPTLVEKLVVESIDTPNGSQPFLRKDVLERLDRCVKMHNASTFMNNVYSESGFLTPDEQKKLLGNVILALYVSTRNTEFYPSAQEILSNLKP